MRNLQPNKRFVFVYLPTKYGHSINQKNIKNRKHLTNLNVLDLHVLEKDYRKTLIDNLSNNEGIKVYDIANEGAENWFLTEEHFSEKGHKEIANKLSNIFLKVIE